MYDSHSEDFGFGDVNWNKQTAKEFFDVLGNHVNDPNIWTYSGTYRGNIPALHYYNPTTHQWVGTTLSGDLLSAWRLSPEQVRYMILLGNIQ